MEVSFTTPVAARFVKMTFANAGTAIDEVEVFGCVDTDGDGVCDTHALVCELKVGGDDGSSDDDGERVAKSLHFEMYSDDPNLNYIWDALFDATPPAASGGTVILQTDQVVTWAEATLEISGAMKLSVKSDKKNPSLKKVKIQKAGK